MQSGGHTSLVVADGEQKSLSRITQTASHQTEEIVGGNEVWYKVC